MAGGRSPSHRRREQAPADSETAHRRRPRLGARRRRVRHVSGRAGTPGGRRRSNSTWPQIDLPESGWPNGRFYWTVVPVADGPDGRRRQEDRRTTSTPTPSSAGRLRRRATWSSSVRTSSPVVAGQGTAYASGLSPTGRLVAATGQRSAVLRSPARCVAARSGRGTATRSQWSHSRTRWRTLGIARRRRPPP